MSDNEPIDLEKGKIVCDDDAHNYDSLRKRFWVQVGLTGMMSAFCITMIAINKNKEGIYLKQQQNSN